MKITAEELLKEVNEVSFTGDILSRSWLKGAYRSCFRGEGMEFEDVRTFSAGDDVRHIDWNVTARSQHPFVKVFREERELKIYFLMDISSSMQFGDKIYTAAKIFSALGQSALKNRDHLGAFFFGDQVHTTYPLSDSRQHFMRILRDYLNQEGNLGVKTDINTVLLPLTQRKGHSSIYFILSDFDTAINKALLRKLAARNDVIALQIEDPLEVTLPPLGLLSVTDLETGEEQLVDCPSYRQKKSLKSMFNALGVSYLKVSTDQSLALVLQRFFSTKGHRGTLCRPC